MLLYDEVTKLNYVMYISIYVKTVLCQHTVLILEHYLNDTAYWAGVADALPVIHARLPGCTGAWR